MKKCILIGLALGLAFTFNSYAGEWKQDTTGTWWQNDDGTYPSGSWQWLDGNGDGISECYYFGQDGYLVTNSVIDGYHIDGNGAWIVEGVVQTQTVQVQDTAETSASSEGGYLLKTSLIKQEYVNLLHKDISEAEKMMGKPSDEFSFGLWKTSTFLVGGHEIEVLSWDLGRGYDDIGKIFEISCKDCNLLEIDDNITSLDDFDNKIGIERKIDFLGNPVWKLSDDFPIYLVMYYSTYNDNFYHAVLSWGDR